MNEEKGLGAAFADPDVFAEPNSPGAFEPGQGEGQGQAAQNGGGDGKSNNPAMGNGLLNSCDSKAEKADGASGDKGSDKQSAGGESGASDKPAGFDRKAWDEFVKGVDPSLGLDSQALQGFGELSEKLGLSAAKAGDMLNFAVEEGKRYQARMRETAEKELREEWGRDFDGKISLARALVERVDRELGEKAGFAKIIEASGLGNNPQFVRGMIMLSSLLSEDSLGEAAGPGWRGREETPYEGLKHFFK